MSDKVIGAINSWPVNGAKPDLEIYYNLSQVKKVVIAEKDDSKVVSIQVPLYDSPELVDNVGEILLSELLTSTSYTDNYNIIFNKDAGGGSISFVDNELSSSDIFLPNSTYVFRITNGKGPYLFVQGYIAIETDDKGGRKMMYYFGNYLNSK